MKRWNPWIDENPSKKNLMGISKKLGGKEKEKNMTEGDCQRQKKNVNDVLKIFTSKNRELKNKRPIWIRLKKVKQ